MKMMVLKTKGVNQTLYQDMLNSDIHVNFPFIIWKKDRLCLSEVKPQLLWT